MNSVDTGFAPPFSWVTEQLASIDGLPRRAVVLTDSSAVAHAVRRHICVELREPRLLAGVAFFRPSTFAQELLSAAGRLFRPSGGESARALRLLQLFQSSALDRRLRYFDARQLRQSLGYASSFAATITELEAGGLTPEELERAAASLAPSDPPSANRLSDIALAWRQADAGEEGPCTAAELLAAATEEVERDPYLTAPHGPVLVLVTGSPSAAVLRFLAALPSSRVYLQEARPWRTGAQRWRNALGLLDEPSLARVEPSSGELAILQRFLFELPEVLTDPERVRSSQPDGRVRFEHHATVEDEIDAAASWVGEAIRDGVPLERIALLVPATAAYALPLIDRLARLGEGAKRVPVHVAGGIDLGSTPAGLRLRLVTTALLGGLTAADVARVLPVLRRRGQTSTTEPRLTPSRAIELLTAAGIAGVRVRWKERLQRHERKMLAAVEATEKADESATSDRLEQRRVRMAGDQARRWLKDMQGLLPAIYGLLEQFDRVNADLDLRELTTSILDFCEAHLLVPPEPVGAVSLARRYLDDAAREATLGDMRGRPALLWLADALGRIPVAAERYGAPAVFVGTPRHAAGLPFERTRLLGMVEGGIPATPHDDPIVPDDLRHELEAFANTEASLAIVPRLADRVLDEIHDVFRVIQNTGEHVVLSSPRQWIDRSERELSGIVLEAATALGRGGGTGTGDVPTAARLRREYFAVSAATDDVASVLTERGRLLSVARRHREAPGTLVVPASWNQPASLAIERLSLLQTRTDALTPSDGSLGDGWHGMRVPGLDGRPLSASALTLLLECPYRFLNERILHRHPPAQPPSTDSIDPARFGELVHAAAQSFFDQCGKGICDRSTAVEELREAMAEIGNRAFDQFVESYPLVGADNLARERARVLEFLDHLVLDEWQRPKRDYVSAEYAFGEVTDTTIALPNGEMRVWGRIDRIDRMGADGLVVRDLKTGRVQDLVEQPIHPGRDLQIGLYVLALEQSPPTESVSRVIEAAYVHPSAGREPERSFSGSGLDRLRLHTAAWLRTAADVLRSGNFVRTPEREDCRRCGFQASCGEGAQQRSADLLSGLPENHDLALFVRLKRSLGRDA